MRIVPIGLKAIRVLGFWVTSWFVFLFIISLQFPYHVLPDIGKFTSTLFEMLRTWLGGGAGDLVSDSRAMYLHTFLLILISTMGGTVSFYLDKDGRHYTRIKYWFRIAIAWYLSLQLFKYGFDKLFKHQFYLPEPNTLFTPLGYLSRDILYWSTIGASYSYNVFMGLLEIIPACFLLFKRTRLFGALIAMAVMLNVLMINLGFDISVKLYSAFLLLLSGIIIAPDIKRLYSVLVADKAYEPKVVKPSIDSPRWIIISAIAKSLVIGLILFECLYIYVITGNFNDDRAARPYLHGAYDVTFLKRNKATHTSSIGDWGRLKRIFIHRRGYFITQYENDAMQDYKLINDLEMGRLNLEQYNGSNIVFDYRYSEKDSLLRLKGLVGTDSIEIVAKQVDLKKLPLMQGEFHWTVQEYEPWNPSQ